jgi:hypothetical protein
MTQADINIDRTEYYERRSITSYDKPLLLSGTIGLDTELPLWTRKVASGAHDSQRMARPQSMLKNG